MKISIQTTRTFDKLFRNLPVVIQKKAVAKTNLFQNNPFHPGLRLEKLRPRHYQVWSFRVDRSYRIIFVFSAPSTAELRYIGPHHSIYDYRWFLGQ